MKSQYLTTLLALLLSAAPSHSAYNGPCEGMEGVCISTSACKQAGGQSFTGYCPNDPTDVKCCWKNPCSVHESLCAWSDQCQGFFLCNKNYLIHGKLGYKMRLEKSDIAEASWRSLSGSE